MPVQIGSVTQVSVNVENVSGGDACTLYYSRGIDGNKFQSVSAVPKPGSSRSVAEFQVSPKVPLQNLRVSCVVQNREFKFTQLEFGYLGVQSLFRWVLPSPAFRFNLTGSGTKFHAELESAQPVSLVYGKFPQNHVLKLLLVAFIAAGAIAWRARAGLASAPAASCAENPWLARLLPVGIFAFIVPCLLIAMKSPEDIHPDEAQHMSATRYYMTHWLPPQIEDPRNAYLYDHYGMTRLNSLGVEYFLAGKLALVIKACGGSDLFACRFFNQFLLVLLFILSLLCAKVKSPLAFVVPVFFLTPQTWYTFSYMNDDGFPFFLVILFLVLYLHDRAAYPVMKGLILGLLVISKANFLVFVLFAGVIALREILQRAHDTGKITLDKRGLRRWAIVLAVAAMVVAGRAAVDIKINGPNRGEKIIAANEKYAALPFKLSTAEKKPGTSIWLKAMRKKGVPAADLIFRYNWLPLTAASFIAVYGYYTTPAPGIYYAVMAVLILALIAYVLGAIIIRRRTGNLVKLGLAVAFLLLIVALAFYRSWDFEFQPQGRHLFPFLGIAAWLMYSVRELLNRRVMNIFFSLFAAAGLYSLIVTAIPALVPGG